MAVYCTLVINERYLAGAIVVAEQLRRLDPAHDIVCLASSTLGEPVKAALAQQFKKVHVVDPVDAGASPELELLNRPELRLATTKLHLWTLPYEQVVYLDADTLPVRGPLDRLFEPVAEGQVAAAPDTGWPDIFNSGVLSLRPSPVTAARLFEALAQRASFDGSDQGLLNQALEWVRLPFVYNVTISNTYQYRPAYLRFADTVRILHFTGAAKPWDTAPGAAGAAGAEVEQWWQAYSAVQSLPPASEPAVLAQRLAYEAEHPAYDASKIIGAPPDYWDAAVHAPLKGTKPEADMLNWQAVESLRVSDDAPAEATGPREQAFLHVFPEFGPSILKLPFEENQSAPERIF